MQNKLLRLALPLVLLFSVLNSGCSTFKQLKVYDREVCADLGEAGADCSHTLKPGLNRELTLEQWNNERIGMLCQAPGAYNDAETAIDQACEMLNCSYLDREELRANFTRLKRLAVKGQKARKKKRRGFFDEEEIADGPAFPHWP